MALGARRSDAVWLIVRDAAVMVGAGIAIALPAVWTFSRLIEARPAGPTSAHLTKVVSLPVTHSGSSRP